MILLERGTLWHRVRQRTDHALAAGALLPFTTEHEFIEDAGVRFFVRILASIARKEEARRQREQAPPGPERATNPFLPYEEDLFVADVTDSHVALLNKFNVVEHHLLIVTRAFEDQDMLLTERDFEALGTCMAEYDGLGFYNGGEAAGASQRHKHLQMVPLPLAPDGPAIPIQPIIDASPAQGMAGPVPGLPFRHAFRKFDASPLVTPPGSATSTFRTYLSLLEEAGAGYVRGQKRQAMPYCLLVTREWMLLVPRSREHYESISLNALGFAGALLVRNTEQLALLKRYGPMAALRRVALPL